MHVNPIRMGTVSYATSIEPSHQARINQLNKNYQDSCSSFNKSKGNDVSFGSSTVPLSNSYFNVQQKDIDKIIQVIKDTDEARLDGSILGVYKYSDFMVKSPDSRLTDTVLKEFYALSRIQQFERGCTAAPIPAAVSKLGERPFLIEEFIEGRPNYQGRYSLVQASAAMKKLLSMDKSGIVNQDLSPANTIYNPVERTVRFIDFDTYSYISEMGQVRSSRSTPLPLFPKLLDQINIRPAEGGILYGTDDGSRSRQISQMFANSFAYRRKRPEGLHNFSGVFNISENPYITAPSNLANYESRTIYTKIMEGDIDDPCEFLRDYLQIKGRTYHRGMRDYLKGLQVSELLCDESSERYSFEEASIRLHKAVEYEDFLSELFQERPDKYFAKLEAAKMQLNALMFHENIDKRVPNYEQIGAAYNNLINVIKEGLYDYREPHYQKYLNAELEKYTEAFSHTAYSTAQIKKPVSDSLDILTVWFSDIEKDPRSFSVVRQKAKDAIKEALCALCKQFDDFDLSPEEFQKKYRTMAENISNETLETIRDTFSGNQFEIESKNLVDETLDEFTGRDLKKLAKAAKDSAFIMLDNAQSSVKNTAKTAFAGARQNARQTAKQTAKRTASRLRKNITSPEQVISDYAKEYAKERYKNQGIPMVLKLLAGGIVAGVGIYKYFSNKNKKVKEYELVHSHKFLTKEDKMPVITKITSDKDSPFKSFSI